MTIRDAAKRWMNEHRKNDLGSEMRASKHYPDRELWFFTFPTSFVDAGKSGHVNLLLQYQGLPEAFLCLPVPYAFFFDNRDKFDVRADGKLFDVHISAKRRNWLIDERSKGVDFGKLERRVVSTGRTLDEINAAAREGFRPLVKAVKPNRGVGQMIAVFQDPNTGEVKTSGDVRFPCAGVKVMDYTGYYPYHFPSPFAAYLVPHDIAVGELVMLEDLIEDIVAVWGNQGYQPRLEEAAAIWNGSDFDIQFDSFRDAPRWVG
jgi:hypothetical protein